MHDLDRRYSNLASWILGLILIVLGVLFLADQYLHTSVGRYLWPFVIMVPGILVFVFALTLKDAPQEGSGFAVVGGIITMIGLILLFQNTTGLWATWAYAW